MGLRMEDNKKINIVTFVLMIVSVLICAFFCCLSISGILILKHIIPVMFFLFFTIFFALISIYFFICYKKIKGNILFSVKRLKKFSLIYSFILVFTLSIGLLFCLIIYFPENCTSPYKYKGEKVDLYTVAINNIFGADGKASNGEAIFDPNIQVIEEDEYGRVLFYYDEYRGYYEEEHYNDFYAILIMQKSTEENVYYYEDYCFATYKAESEEYFESVINGDYSVLKEQNDWGKAFNEGKCTKKAISRYKERKLEIYEKDFEEIIKVYISNLGGYGSYTTCRYYNYYTSDRYGREIYNVCAQGETVDGTYVYFDLAVIFNPDGSYGGDNFIIEVEDMFNFKDEIIEFKKLNGWNEPYLLN